MSSTGDEAERDGYGLSPIQRSRWLLDERNGAPDGLRCDVETTGPLDPVALTEALRRVVDEHEILRTSFPVPRNMRLPVQVIADRGRVDLREVDLTGAAEAERNRRLDAALTEPVDLDVAGEPVLRTLLIRLAADRHRLVVRAPALRTDGGSMRLLVRDVVRHYAALTGRAGEINGAQVLPPDAESPPQYADVAAWLDDLLQSPDSEPGRSHWAALAGRADGTEPLVRPVPFARVPPGPGGRFCPDQRGVELPPDTLAAAEAVARATGGTVESVLLTAWQVLLWRLDPATDPLVAVARDGRDLPELSDVVGPMTRYVPRPVRLGAATPFDRTVADLVPADRDIDRWHAYFSLAEWRRPGDPAGGEPYLPVLFDYATGQPQYRVGAVTFRLTEVHGCAERYDLMLRCVREAGGLTATLHYNGAALDGEAADRLAGHLGTLLADALDRPGTPIGDLAVLTGAQRRQLAGFGTVAPPGVREPACFHELFAAQARRTPDRVAVRCGEESLTFVELDERANQLAHYLRRRGVGPDMLVGLCLGASPEAMVTLLAVQKAGAGYAPIDPDDPPQRIAFQARDASLALLLTRTGLLPVGFDGNVEMPVVRLDVVASEVRKEEVIPPTPLARPDNLAYAIYTSGSTGSPKGVLVEHRSVSAFRDAMRAAVYDRHLDGHRDVALNAPLTFDASVQQLVLLLDGHTLHLLPQWLRRDDRLLVDYLRRNRVDVVNATPTQLETLVSAGLLAEDGGPGRPPALLLVAGEVLPAPLAAVLGRAGRTVAYNCYGPTECTVNATGERVGPEEPPAIGRPLPGYRVAILDRRLRQVPVGVAGEIYLGGPAVARGYLGRPELTATRFVPDPAAGSGHGPTASEPGGRLYRTGDLGRFGPDGRIWYLGRADQQVKLRGFRIEPAEVAAALSEHPAVREAAVVVRELGGGCGLVAYCVFGPGSPPSDSSLREFLADRLPVYMVPAVFVALDALPVTRGGKLDRAALPAPTGDRRGADLPYAAPRLPREEILCAVWAAVLGVDRVGIDDDFFALGGDSIRSIQLRAAAAERNIHLSVQQLFQHRTVRELSHALDSVASDGDDDGQTRPLPAFALIDDADRSRLPAGVADAYPLTHGQAGMVFDSEFRRDAPVFHTTRTAHLRAPLRVDAFREALDQLTDAHPALRTSFAMLGYTEPLQLVHRTVTVPLEVHDLSHLPDAEQSRAVAEFCASGQRHRFGWDRPPFLRFAIHRRSADRFQLTVTLHEAVLDGWSVASLLTELFTRYLALLAGRPAAVQPHPTSYADFVARERLAARRAGDAEFWTDRLAGTAGTPLPRWTRDGAAAQHVVEVPISEQTGTALRALARSLAVPVKSVLLAAHLRAVSLATGEADVVTGLVSNGRLGVPGGDRVLGQFLNTLPVRARLTGTGTWADLVRAVFDAESAQLPHRRFPVTRIVRGQRHRPVVETAFNFTHFHVYRSLEQAGIEVLDDDLFDRTGLPLLADFSADPLTGSIRATLNCTDLPPEQVTAIAGYYRECLADLADRPEGRYGEPWSAIGAQSGADRLDQCFAELFEARVQRAPDAVAVVCRGQSITYGGLNGRANRLAELVADAGAGPETVVPILAGRGIDLVTAIVAVQKVGAAYTPLEPTDPVRRLREALRRSPAPLVLSTTECLPVLDKVLADWEPARRPTVITVGAAISLGPLATNPPRRGGPRSLACLLHTSGSTGTPKGVMLERRGVLNHAYAKIDELGLTAADRVAQTARSTFVVSVWQFLAPLMVGATVVVVTDHDGRDPARLLRELARTDVTVAEAVPSMLAAMATVAGQEPVDLPRLRWMVSTGEALPGRTARRWLARYPAAGLVNAYGPTECSDDVTHYRVPATVTGAGCPVGRPIPHIRLYLLDRDLAPVPAGTAAQLFVGGPGVGRGYLGDPAQTAAVFRPDPFLPGGRMYRTGDLARQLPDGTVEYLGRQDRQVQIHGIRIEPGEVEAVLARHEAVADAVVTARSGESGTFRLVAYVVGRGGTPVDPAALVEYARGLLPAAYLPAAFVNLPAVPRNANGKVDHAALPAPESAVPTGSEPHRLPPGPPRTRTERVVAEAYAEVLGLDAVGAADDFFVLGGDSLSVTLLAFRLRVELAVDLPLHLVYEHPTVAELARVVDAAATNAPTTAVTPSEDE
ncbi:non-ribosomal peptide synthetase [Plantactinospora sp. KLBMP9567]|uniref:non-ribosomal peptide synthetase n=1 Tax=Plantactinospora sp. KLBMP9567 TaxID=3085900 RepID=UPI00298165B9|nr:non-ribosomal peptide synthetase [Plantactinospora sp. KLBMP9567]MDW5329219.1 amino acid adenylation domain-containing protein [Plantactinospora sp. KLBMP9567]